MNKDLFANALSSLLVVSDYAEYLDTRRSFIVDSLCKLGYPKKAAISFLLRCASLEQKRAADCLKQIEREGLSREFEIWSDQDEVIEERMQGLLTAMTVGMQALSHPHRFH
ncbi:MAG: hypothetical protein ACLUYS_07500 [Allobaculum sp.]|uniref:hypothetical protein n=1 Tax=Allobaculum sp. TaxID=1872463 RepID=UPI00399A7B68